AERPAFPPDAVRRPYRRPGTGCRPFGGTWFIAPNVRRTPMGWRLVVPLVAVIALGADSLAGAARCSGRAEGDHRTPRAPTAVQVRSQGRTGLQGGAARGRQAGVGPGSASGGSRRCEAWQGRMALRWPVVGGG